ncbi:MAG: hypothetical protein AAF735_03240 [Myxococcota bacterium]
MNNEAENELAERILIVDGAIRTMIQWYRSSDADFREEPLVEGVRFSPSLVCGSDAQ